MSHFRISILGMVGLVAMLGFWLASLMAATAWWTTAASTVTLAILLSSLLAAYHLRGLDGAYWSGFALFGVAYLILVNWDWVGGQFGHDLTQGIGDLAELVFPRGPKANTTVVTPFGPRTMPISTTIEADPLERSIRIGNFVQIARLGSTLLFAMLGGLIGRFLGRGRGAEGPRFCYDRSGRGRVVASQP